MIKKFWHNISNLDKLCYALVIAFGICLLALMIFFQFGYKLGEIQAKPFLRQEKIDSTTTQLLLIDEPSPVIRGIEIVISIGMIILGAERLTTYNKRTNDKRIT